jgi:peptidoglycan/LPS O-acetylase OafA/YrhL
MDTIRSETALTAVLDRPTGTVSKHASEIRWLDAVKAVALMWIIFDHSVERLIGGAFLGNPASDWPPLGERIAQLFSPVGHGFGPFGIFVRDVAWIGDEGVGVFLVISGLGLAWGLQRSALAFDVRDFLHRRLTRIFPTWWTAHITIGLPLLVVGGVSLPVLLLSAAGIRFLPATVYAIVPAWWYVGLLLQLYAVFPLLWMATRRFGPVPAFAAAAVIGLGARALGLLATGPFMEEFFRGSIFVSRLPEFAFGVALAAWCGGDPSRLTALLRSPRVIAMAAVSFVAGNAAALTLGGEIFAPLVTSAGAFTLIAATASAVLIPELRWIGRHSLSLYLVHQAAINALVPANEASAKALVALSIALVGTPFLAIGLERLTNVLQGSVYRRGALAPAAAIAAAIFVLLCAGEWSVRRFDPQEAWGWGERPSLVADSAVGWKMRPSSTTHLRWESYDYIVSSNELGFPESDPRQRVPGSKLMMTVGNAFTSAEGVDTDRSWPRMLQRDDPTLNIANFAITGHGPNQYAEVVRTYGPKLRPDIVFVGMYVKDFEDSLVGERAFQQSIGFDKASPDSRLAFFRFPQLSRYIALRIAEPLKAAFRRQPNPEDYFLGGFVFFDRRHDVTPQEYAATRTRLQEIRDTAATWGGQVVIGMFPAAAQVCRPDEVAYYPKNIAWNGSDFDRERPQRLIRQVARDLHVRFIDMRKAFIGPSCGYQAHNMHLTDAGQSMISSFMLKTIGSSLARLPK